MGKFRPSVSPNGDGYHDRLRVPVKLTEAAFVHAEVTNTKTGKVVKGGCLTIPGGHCRYEAGWSKITWMDLRQVHRIGSKPLPDGTYRVVLSARPVSLDKPMREYAKFTFDYFSAGLTLDKSVYTYPEAGDSGLALSPNGDGVQDEAKVKFVLERRSRVTAVLSSRTGGATYRVQLGKRDAGTNSWTWDGRLPAGSVIPDDSYYLSLQGRPVGGGPVSKNEYTASVTVDTVAPDPSIALNRATVYPYAAAISDSLRVGLDVDPFWVTADVLGPNGKRVVKLKPSEHECYWGDNFFDGRCTLLTWYAKTSSGPAGVGDYQVRITVRDQSGNAVTVRKPVTVSNAQLAEKTATVSWTAATSPGANDFCMGNYCGEAPVCNPVASERFPGGWSFRSNPDECRTYNKPPYALRNMGFAPDFTALAGVGPTKYDRFRVTATGGPTTVGADDVITVGTATNGEFSTTAPDSSVQLMGETTATTAWAPVRNDVQLYPNDVFLNGNLPMRWYSRATGGNRYDIASYTLEYTYWKPVT